MQEEAPIRKAVVERWSTVNVLHRVLCPQVHVNGFFFFKFCMYRLKLYSHMYIIQVYN